MQNFTKYLNLIEETIKSEVNRFNFLDQRHILIQACKHSLSAKAKRIRPLLVILSFLLFREEKDLPQILPLALAIELIHTYSLIHDDLPSMDNDDFRRGQLTCHKKFNEAIAILTGDMLNTYAFEILADDLSKHFTAKKVLETIKLLSQAIGCNGMIGGQVLDMETQNNIKSEKHLILIHSLKTGALLQSSIVLPAILCGAKKSEINLLKKFGNSLGLLFQIIDDILDTTQETTVLGKSAGKDVVQNKLTYVTLLGLKKAKIKAEKTYQKANIYLNKLSNLKTTKLKNLLEYVYNRDY